MTFSFCKLLSDGLGLTWAKSFDIPSRCRFSCVPVDFEVVNVNSSLASEDEINDAITAIRRNGVALKGVKRERCFCFLCVKAEKISCVSYNQIIFLSYTFTIADHLFWQEI